MHAGHWIIALALALSVAGCTDMQMSGGTAAPTEYDADENGDY